MNSKAFPHGPESLGAFQPAKDGAWDQGAAAHLVRRAAFGSPQAVVRKTLELGPGRAASALLEPAGDDEGLRVLTVAARGLGSLESVQGWWLYRMLLGPRPARDKLALFWHGHFATSNRKVERPRLMMRQVELFQTAGSGPFGKLLIEVARDPAMLIWLDGNSNRRGKPNENFARELMELFSLGIGNYTEEDIKEAARTFTGWHVRNGEFWFNERAHDQAAKRVFGHDGKFGGEDTVRLCLERRACSEFIASKLFKYYVHPRPTEELRKALGELYESCGKVTGKFLAKLWSSKAFYSQQARRSLVSTPVDFVVGSLATLGSTANTQQLARATEAMGQNLLEPPSVKGWESGLAWLNSTTLLARYRFATEVTGGERFGTKISWEELEGVGADGLLARFFPEGLPEETRRSLVEAAAGDVKMLVAGCLGLPEYQYI